MSVRSDQAKEEEMGRLIQKQTLNFIYKQNKDNPQTGVVKHNSFGTSTKTKLDKTEMKGMAELRDEDEALHLKLVGEVETWARQSRVEPVGA